MNLSTSTCLNGQELSDLLTNPEKYQNKTLGQLFIGLTIQGNGKIKPDKYYTLKLEVSEGMR